MVLNLFATISLKNVIFAIVLMQNHTQHMYIFFYKFRPSCFIVHGCGLKSLLIDTKF